MNKSHSWISFIAISPSVAFHKTRYTARREKKYWHTVEYSFWKSIFYCGVNPLNDKPFCHQNPKFWMLRVPEIQGSFWSPFWVRNSIPRHPRHLKAEQFLMRGFWLHSSWNCVPAFETNSENLHILYIFSCDHFLTSLCKFFFITLPSFLIWCKSCVLPTPGPPRIISFNLLYGLELQLSFLQVIILKC